MNFQLFRPSFVTILILFCLASWSFPALALPKSEEGGCGDAMRAINPFSTIVCDKRLKRNLEIMPPPPPPLIPVPQPYPAAPWIIRPSVGGGVEVFKRKSESCTKQHQQLDYDKHQLERLRSEKTEAEKQVSRQNEIITAQQETIKNSHNTINGLDSNRGYLTPNDEDYLAPIPKIHNLNQLELEVQQQCFNGAKPVLSENCNRKRALLIPVRNLTNSRNSLTNAQKAKEIAVSKLKELDNQIIEKESSVNKGKAMVAKECSSSKSRDIGVW